MPEELSCDRRRFIRTAAMTIGAARIGLLSPLLAQTACSASSPAGPELSSIDTATQWFNSPPLTATGLRGKVVLVDFCTYTCVNWLRTLPYVRAWATKYQDQGLVIVGAHTPEFLFEKDVENVRRALKEWNVDYPVVMDNDYAIWRAFRNNFWPALYFVDTTGRVRQHHFGEGEYEQSEKDIQRLLADAGLSDARGGLVSVDPRGLELAADWSDVKSSETYVGFEKAQRFASPDPVARDKPRVYSVPSRLQLNHWSLAGDWTVQAGSAAANKPNARIAYRFHARDVNLVMGPAVRDASIPFRVHIDGNPPGAARGVDVDGEGVGKIDYQRTYQLIRQPKPIRDRQFEIEFLDPGAEAFCFTFG